MEPSLLNSTMPALDTVAEVRISGDGKECPVVITFPGKTDNLEFCSAYKNEINALVLQHGAVLLRGLPIGSAEAFNSLFSILAGEAMVYRNRTSPRDQVFRNVYTSTSHPSDQVIHMHTENSYSTTYNRIIAFYCLVPPVSGGETPIADERRLAAFLGPDILDVFRQKGIQYTRNTIPGIGLDWRTIYQTEDRLEVNGILEESGMEYKWISDDHLRVKWSLPAFQTHPITGEEVWFNHMYFGHRSLCDPNVLEFFDEEDLPFVTRYGDGTSIGDEVIRRFSDFYDRHSIVFRWEKDDLLLLDNMLFSHGRRAYKGQRTILTAMAQPITFQR